MKMLNRNAVIVKPKQPYRDWMASVAPSEHEVEDTEYPVYLLPEARDGDRFQRILKQHYALIFENELFGWYTDETSWPQQRDWETFCAWFEVEFAPEVMDLAEERLTVEDL